MFAFPGQFEQVLDLRLVRTVEHRRGGRNTGAQVSGHFDDLIVAERIQVFTLTTGVVDLFQIVADLADLPLFVEHLADALAHTLGRKTKVGLENLSDVHPRRDTERIENDIDRTTPIVERHVFDRHDLGNDALVSVTAGHLVTGLNPTLDGNVDLDHFQDAGRQVVPSSQLALFLLELFPESLTLSLDLLCNRLDLPSGLFVAQTDL